MGARKESFFEFVTTIEDDETRLLKLQERYESGEIDEEDLTTDEIIELSGLYNKQINNLKKSNESRKQKLLEYRKSMK